MPGVEQLGEIRFSYATYLKSRSVVHVLLNIGVNPGQESSDINIELPGTVKNHLVQNVFLSSYQTSQVAQVLAAYEFDAYFAYAARSYPP